VRETTKNEIAAALQASPGEAEGTPALAIMERKVRIGFAFALACMVLIGAVSYVSLVRLLQHAQDVGHAHEMRSSLELLLAAATDSETAERGYVITDDDSYLEPYRRAAAVIDGQTTHLRELTAENPTQRRRLDSVISLVADRLQELRSVMELRKNQGFAAAQREILTGKGKLFHDQIRSAIAQMENSETAALAERERQTHTSAVLARAVIVGGGILGCGFVGLALFAIRRDFAGRTQAELALYEANENLELRVRERTGHLAAAHERTRAIIDTALDGIVTMNHEGEISDFNPAAEEIFGYRRRDVIGQPLAEVLIPEASREEYSARLERYLTLGAAAVSSKRIELMGLRADGALVPLELSINRMPGAGPPTFAGFVREITDRKLGEAKVQAQLARLNLLHQITQAIGERQDIQSIFQVVIRTLEEHLPVDFCCICRYEPGENALTVTSVGLRSEALATELAMSEHARVEIDRNSRCVRGRLVYEPDIAQSPFPFAQRLTRGALHAVVAAPLLVESQVFGVLIAARREAHSFSSGECEFLRQASEHVALAAHQARLHLALQQAYDDLRQTQRAVMQQERLLALGQMASGIAHDINNAISPVTLYTDSLLESEPGLSARGRGQLEIIQRAVDDVARTVARMREFYRPREPQLMLQRVNLNSLAQQVLDLTRARWSDMAQQRGIVIEMRTDLAPDLPEIMGADNELREALINLIFNAVDAMPLGGPLTLRTRVVREGSPAADGSSEGGAFVRIEVIDAGIGMDDETRRRCLEPFFSTKGERGTGLGLAMVYGTAQRHSADIEIESAVGKGTIIRLSFAIPSIAASATAVWSATSPVTALRILVVDDDPLVLKSLRDTLESDGHEITTADGGQAGIDSFLAAHRQGNPFPVVITDLGMPYVDGRKVSSAVKVAAPGTIVFLLTGWGQRLVAEGDVPAHVDCVLSKPPKLRELREAFARSFSGRVS
jgi:PAS domain S-box-containing protein